MGVGTRDIVFLCVVLGGVVITGAGLLRPSKSRSSQRTETSAPRIDPRPVAELLDATFRSRWAESRIQPAGPAPELAVMRRLSLALCGTIPSLEEVRRFEARPAGQRISPWLEELLGDRRCADYLAERFARAYVGTEDGPFLLFRRRRFIAWLSTSLMENRPYDALVRDLIADNGLWTDHPATNFVSVTFDPELGRPTPERLAARVSRAFLGVRIDCAQCHDHPFQPWKQADFRGLAAFFGGVHSNLRGIRDGENNYRPTDRKTGKPVAVEPTVPFCPDMRPTSGSPREQLAAWVIHPKNRHFARATVNRVWALLFGRPLAEPIDDLPAAGELHPALDVLADDFASHGFDLHRLIRVIASAEVFRRESATAESENPTDGDEESWAIFPMTRLRPDQVAGALFQATKLTTINADSHWFVQFISYAGRNDFVRRYGDTGEDEFDARGGTIPQRLLLMNGEVVRERIKDDFFNAATQIARLAPDDDKAVNAAYLAVLTRRPTDEELAHFRARLAGTGGQDRNERLGDLYWTLLNTTEFSWNH